MSSIGRKVKKKKNTYVFCKHDNTGHQKGRERDEKAFYSKLFYSFNFEPCEYSSVQFSTYSKYNNEKLKNEVLISSNIERHLFMVKISPVHYLLAFNQYGLTYEKDNIPP